MKKIVLTFLASLCVVLALTACGTESGDQIQYRIADRTEGQELLLSNTEYYDGFTENDLQFRTQSKDASMEEYLSFAKDQVLDFSEEQKTMIDKTVDRLEEVIEERGYQLPSLDEITFICTTMEEECGAAAYTHGTQIYIGSDYIDSCIGNSDGETAMLHLMGHELFHCLTRSNPDFRADMYKLIHFTVQEEEYELPPSALEYYISNPDVEHHNAWATFEIDGKPMDCFMALATKEHFRKKGDSFFDTATSVLIPVDGTDQYYYPEDAANYHEVLGENTEYTIDPEECMADNFSYLITYDADGPDGKGYKTPEIIDGIRDYLKQEQTADPEPDYTTGTPWIDSNLEGVVTEDTRADLKDDFFLHVNKDALLDLKIPKGYPYGGIVVDVVIDNQEDMKAMFLGEEPQSHDSKLAYDLFGLMMDWDTRNEQGVKPLKEKTDIVENIQTLDELTSYFRETPAEKQIGALWTTESAQDLLDSDSNIIVFDSMDLLLEDSAEYSKLTDYGKIKKEAKTKLVKNMLGKLGYNKDDAQQKIDHCMEFETMLAAAALTSEEKQSPDYLKRSNNYFTRGELKKIQGQVPLLGRTETALGFPKADKYQVTEPKYIRKLSELYTDENLPLIRDTLIVHCLEKNAWMFDRECYDWYMECDSSISGSTGTRGDEKVFADRVSEMLPWPVARMYTETYLNEKDKKRISEMVDETLDVYHEIISDADFLSEKTREKALQKLEAINKKILYPDNWEPYSMQDLEFASAKDGGTLWEAADAIAKYEAADQVKRYIKPYDRARWVRQPQIVNCCYDPQTNSVYILGAFAQGGLYNHNMKDEELYARLGCVIGHEISHAFDSGGAQFDQEGNMKNWWSDEDGKAFREKNKKLAAYFDNMHPWEGQDFHGKIMTGEACADMAGFKAMLLIAEKKPEFDYDAFFRNHARLWMAKDSLQKAYSRIEDVHPMMYLRANGTLQQYDEFLDFYGIKEGDGMYLAPEDRVAIW